MLQMLKDRMKNSLSSDQIAAFRIFLARLGRRTATSLEEMWLDRLARAGEIKNFIQIGANDGSESDPVASVIRRHRLKGVMVEPIHFYFERLRNNYSGRQDIKLVNAAIAESDEERSIYYLPPDHPDLPGWANGLGSFDRNVILSHSDRIPGIGMLIKEIKVPCMSFSRLIEKTGTQRFDLLITDTEGYDYHVIKQVDLNYFQPKVILFESKHLSSGDRKASKDMLARNQYIHIESNDNIIAFESKLAFKWRIRAT